MPVIKTIANRSGEEHGTGAWRSRCLVACFSSQRRVLVRQHQWWCRHSSVPMNWEMNKQLGEFAANKGLWDQHTVINQLDKIQPGDLSLIIDCGEGDFFLLLIKTCTNTCWSVALIMISSFVREFITDSNWHNSIDYQILFFQKFFLKK